MPYPRTKRYARFAKRGLKKRYLPKNRRGKRSLAVGRLAADVYKIKRSLNSETQFIDTDVTMTPVRTAPALLALDTPDTQGVALNQRVGAKVKFCHLSAKLNVIHQNYGNETANLTLCFHVVWLKNGLFAADFEANPGEYMLNPDFNGDYSPLSYWNQQNYKNWISVHKFQVTMKDLQPPSQSAYGLQTTPDAGVNTETSLARQPQTQRRYININKPISVHTEWANIYNTTPGVTPADIVHMKPYVFCYTDAPSQSVPSGVQQPSGQINDRLLIQGTCRLSYKDN